MAKKGSKKNLPKTFVFRKHANIGAADAIEDKKFLIEAFVDNGELEILRDNKQPECIILGRTGSGKTALIEKLNESEEKVVKIAPESLALTYVSNNEVLNFFIQAGVNMDLFYRLLWRHVFAVEIIREHYHIINEESRDNFLTRIKDRIFKNKARQEAIAYLLKWGESFWKDSEYRVKEVTKNLEQSLEASLSSSLQKSLPGLANLTTNLNADLAKKLSEEQKLEVVSRGQAVVNTVQMKTLSEIMDLLEVDILDDKKKKYYITIDRLDENWVNDDLRYRLIRALLDTVRDFNTKIQNVKIIIAIREDLLERVFRYTRDPGYQEEKYKSLYLPLTWRQAELEILLSRRVDQLVKEQYTTKQVGVRDLLPSKINKEDSLNYLLSRTMLRPRDAIMFLNECIKASEGKPQITQASLFHAEAIYSENRLRALADEWTTDYPNLIELALFLKKFPKQFKMEEIEEQIVDCMLDFLIQNLKQDFIHSLIRDKFDNTDVKGFMQEMFKILFRVGIVGVKQDSYVSISWSYQGKKLIGSEINLDSTFYIHPAFWRVLGIQP